MIRFHFEYHLINNNVLDFPGIDYVNSVDWVIKNSKTAKVYQEKTTLLCCVYGHVDKEQSYLSSKDLHYLQILGEIFPHVQSLVVDIRGIYVLSHKFFVLTQHGKHFLSRSRCFKRPHTFHGCCARSDYYQPAKHNFYDYPSMIVVDLNRNITCDDDFVLNVDGQQDLAEKRQMSLEEVKELAPARLKKSGFCLSTETVGNGNCFINAIIDQMR